MKKYLFVAALFSFYFFRTAHAEDFFVFRATAVLPVTMVVIGNSTDTIIKKTIKTDDLVNLALGRALGTKVDKRTEILGVAGTFEEHAPVPKSKLIVFDPSENGVNQKKATVATLSELDYTNAYQNKLNSGQGYGRGTWVAAVLGDPAKNGLLAASFQAAGVGSGLHYIPPDAANVVFHGTGYLQGRFKFNTTEGGATTVFDGIVAKGTVIISGKRLGFYSE